MRTGWMILAALLLVGCVAFKPKLDTLILGRWEAPEGDVSFDFDKNHSVAFDSPKYTGRGAWTMRNGEVLLQIGQLTAKDGGPAKRDDQTARGYISAEGALMLKSAGEEIAFRRIKTSKFTIKPLGGGPEPTPLPRTPEPAPELAPAPNTLPAPPPAAAGPVQATPEARKALLQKLLQQAAQNAAQQGAQQDAAPSLPQDAPQYVTPGASPLDDGPPTGGRRAINRPRTMPRLVRPGEQQPAQDNNPQGMNGNPQQGQVGYPQGYNPQGYNPQGMNGYPQQGMGDPQQGDNPQQQGGNQP